MTNSKRYTRKRLAMAGITAFAFLVIAALCFREQATSALSAPEPTSAAAGEELYKQNCLSCHAAEGAGSGRYPALVSDKFKKKYGSYDKAYAFISTNMPDNAPGTLREEEYEAIVNYVLALNGIPAEFADIGGHWAEQTIRTLWRKQAIDGYTAGGKLLFKPEQRITRAEFVAYLVKTKQLFLSGDAGSAWTDIGKNKYRTQIVTAIDYGIVDGYPDSTFRPDQPISRAEIAAILSRSEALDTDNSAPAQSFRDVPEDHWAYGAIRASVQTRLFDGYADGTFRPDQPMSRAEAAAVLSRIP